MMKTSPLARALVIGGALLCPFGPLGCEKNETSKDDAADEEDEGDPEDEEGSEGDEASGDEASGDEDSGDEAEDGVVGPPEPGQLPELKVGSWAKYRVMSPDGKTKKGEATWSTLKKRKGDEYLVEGDVSLQMPMVAQAWVEIGDLRDPDTIELKELKAKIGGNVREFPVGGKSPVGKIFDRFLVAGFPKDKIAEAERVTVEVPAGKFEDCYKWTQTTSVMGITATSTIYTHPAIPLPSMAKNESKTTVWELVDYGEEGAESSL